MATMTLAEIYKPNPSKVRARERANARYHALRELREAHPAEYKRFYRNQAKKYPSDYTKMFNESVKKLVARYPEEFNKLRTAELKKRNVL